MAGKRIKPGGKKKKDLDPSLRSVGGRKKNFVLSYLPLQHAGRKKKGKRGEGCLRRMRDNFFVVNRKEGE